MKISGKGQVVIPAPIRRKYGWKPGFQVVVKEARPMEIVLKKKTPQKDLVAKYRGSMKGIAPSLKEYLDSKKEDIRLEE